MSAVCDCLFNLYPANPQYLEAVSSLGNLRTYHDVVTESHLSWRRGEVHTTEFWWGNLSERDQLGEPGVAGRIILEWILIKCVEEILLLS